MYVAAIMFVLAVIERAGDPDAWRWLWAFNGNSVQRERFNNRLDVQGHRTAHDPPGTFVAASASKPDGPASASDQLDPVKRAWEQGWKDVLSRLPADEQSLLFEILHATTLSRGPQAGAVG